MQLFFRLILAFLSLCFSSIVLQAQQPEVCRTEAHILNDRAANLGALGDEKKMILAIDLLDKAIAIKPDYYQAYWNKVVLLYRLEKREDYVRTLQTMEKQWPSKPDIKVMLGVHYEFVLGDTLSANTKYREAKQLYKTLYDSIQVKTLDVGNILPSYCTLLKLLGEDKEAYRIWRSFDAKRCEIPEYCMELKRLVKEFVLSRSRQELLEMYTGGAAYSGF